MNNKEINALATAVTISRVEELLTDYRAIVGPLPRQDIQSLVVLSKDLVSDLTSLKAENEKLKALLATVQEETKSPDYHYSISIATDNLITAALNQTNP